jgi:hypothetical protein
MEITNADLMREAEKMALLIRFQEQHIAALERRIADLTVALQYTQPPNPPEDHDDA